MRRYTHIVPQRLNPFSYRQRLALVVVPPLAALLIRLLGSTLRYHDITSDGLASGDHLPRPAIYVFWHRSLLACAHRFRGQGIAILISRSFDGELIARTVEHLGFLAVRGSSSRAGASGLRGLERAYNSGRLCAITADGPKGPSMVAKPGATHLATLVHASKIAAFHAMPARAWTLRSWDHFLIPKPFSKVIVTWPRHASPDLPAVQSALDQAVATAEAHIIDRLIDEL